MTQTTFRNLACFAGLAVGIVMIAGAGAGSAQADEPIDAERQRVFSDVKAQTQTARYVGSITEYDGTPIPGQFDDVIQSPDALRAELRANAIEQVEAADWSLNPSS